MDTQLSSERKYFFYDPTSYGLNDDVIQIIGSGGVTAVGGKLRVNNGKFNTLFQFFHGKLQMKVTIPTAPTAGDSRIIGVYSRAWGNRNAYYIYINGSNIHARTYSERSAVAESTALMWDSSWTNTPIMIEFIQRIDRVEFWIGKLNEATRRVAVHCTTIPALTLMPVYVSNSNADNMDVHFINIKDARKLVMANPGFYTSTSSTSSSTSSSTYLLKSDVVVCVDCKMLLLECDAYKVVKPYGVSYYCPAHQKIYDQLSCEYDDKNNAVEKYFLGGVQINKKGKIIDERFKESKINKERA